MTDTMKKDLIEALTDACESLHGLEMVGSNAGSSIESQARDMLDALEDHLRVLDPDMYGPGADREAVIRDIMTEDVLREEAEAMYDLYADAK